MRSALKTGIFLFVIPIVYAQYAGLSGVVRDPSGAIIPGASVTARNEETHATRLATSSEEGLYLLSLIPAGRYTVTIRAAGFQIREQAGVKLDVGQSARLDFELTPGTLEQSVTVNAESALVRTDSATVSTVINRQFIENLPLSGRSFQSLIALTPGVVLTKATFGEQGQFSVNGQRANANYFTIDGVSANIGVSAGIAPGLVRGAMQITIPTNVTAGRDVPVVVKVGEATSNTVTIAIQ
jgi:uncharacterized protein (TIGR03437 family)